MPKTHTSSRGARCEPYNRLRNMCASDFGVIVPSEEHPPGLYQGPAGTRALNVAAEYSAVAMTDWPAAATLLGDTEARTFRLGGVLLATALGLLCVDLIVALALAGRLPLAAARAAVIALTCSLGAGLIAGDAYAQAGFSILPNDDSDLDKETAAALNMRFAYIETGDARTDRATRAGLEGLGLVLFRRSSVEPAAPHAVDPETDALDVYPVLFLALPDSPTPLSETAIARP